jgi:AcrR family transcriptional regulator
VSQISGKGSEEGLRARKRRETAERIIEAALTLFANNGYDATTLDEIAASADISRRTFFHYFKTKDDILLSLQSDLGAALAAAVRTQPTDVSPLATIREVIADAASRFSDERALLIDRIMRSSASIQARKSAAYIEHERTLLNALRDRWPDPKLETRLRLIAMQAIGAIRLATEAFSAENGKRSLPTIFRDYFDALDLSALPASGGDQPAQTNSTRSG